MDVLLVEDSSGDVRLMQLVFHEVFTSVQSLVANSGLEALAVLRWLGPNAESPRPDLIVLDLNMPKILSRRAVFFGNRWILMRLQSEYRPSAITGVMSACLINPLSRSSASYEFGL
jgi:CheY-like chemotaxis protein